MSAREPRDRKANRTARRTRYRAGWMAEGVAVAYLSMKGYRLIARRFKTHLGEVDLIVVRNKRIAFVEVKYRQTMAFAEAAITSTLRQRVRRSAGLWLAKHPRYQGYDVGFDLVMLCPRTWPLHIENGL